MKKLKTLKANCFRPGQLVQWYEEGWRAGYVVGVHPTFIRVRLVPAYKAAPGRARRIPITDIVPVD